jgi:hypothetical protein
VSGVDLDAVERTLRVLAERAPTRFVYHDPSNGQRVAVSPEALASRSGFLPAIVNAGEAVWREATGKGFELDVAHDPEALLGYRLRAIWAGSFTSVMLSAMEAINQVAGPNVTGLSALNALWAASVERLRPDMASPPARPGPRP